MKAMMRIFTLVFTFAIATNLFAVDPPRFNVSTSFGGGADAQLNEHSNNGVTAGSAGDLNTRTSVNGDRNEIVALRFDLSDHALSNLTGVTLNLVNFRDNSARQVALYGVKQGSVGATGFYSTEDWDESALTTFGDMPGLAATDGDFTTQSLNSEQLTFLGQITFSNLQKGTFETFSDPGLTAFIRSYTGSSLVTIILAAAPDYTSTGQARFAAKEAVALDGGNPTGNPGDFAPYLSFGQVGGSVPPSVLITAPANGADINLGVPIPIEISATDDGTIARVEFYAGTEDPLTRLGEDTSAPYSFTFTPPSAGTYIIRAVATDDQALTGEHSVTVDVGAANPPVVTITSPADNAIILKDAMIVLAATVTDDVSVAKVEFYAGTTEP
ncbi:MAG: Ig-like domain-containing protein, partial [Limisphaerales bacterium]